MAAPIDLKGASAIAYPAAGDARAALVLAHGAGAGQQHPFMVAMARGLAARGIDIVTFDFPYMAQKRRTPDRAPVLEQAFGEALSGARAWSAARHLFIGGKSMGGRMATHLGARGEDDLSGIVVFGYPLHPPGKPDQLRSAHLPSIRVPVLIVQGERDTFGTPEELSPVLRQMPETTLHVVRGGDHSLSVRGRQPQEVYDEVLDFTADWIRART
jgi:predicted alpha/beta-hydrolase family hydrolase